MNILIVGNGATGVKNDFHFLINNHTGDFLMKLNRSHSVTFVQYSSKYNENNDLQNFELETNGIRHVELSGNKSLTTYKILIALIKNSDMIYIFYPGTLGKIVGILSILLSKKISLYVRGEHFNKSILDKIILKRSSFILTVSKFFQKNLNDYCKNVEVIKPMISINLDDFNERSEITSPISKFLFVGRVEENKGIYDLIEIIKTLNESGRKVCVDIVGGGDAFEKIRDQIIKDNLSYIRLHGLISNKEELKHMYNSSDAFLFTSHFEGFPRVLYEAMAAGLPIFTTFVGGIPGLMNDKQNCIKIPTKDSERASKIILNALEDVELMNKIGKNGQHTLKGVLSGAYLEHDQLLISKL